MARFSGLGFVVLIGIIWVLAASAVAQQRTITPVPTDPQSLAALYGESWAVVIGIDRYQKAPRLTYAINDARSLAASLRAFGFQTVITIENEQATAQEIRRILGDELPKRVSGNDRVLVFFAGHGETRDLGSGKHMGYLVPVDGDPKALHATSISMREISDFADLIDAKHVLFLIDACYGGLTLRDTAVVPKRSGYLGELTRKSVKQIITAGGKDERVIEEGGHGLFTKFLLKALDQGDADDGDGVITAMQLGSYLQKRVAEASSRYGKPHTPLYGRLAGDGDFVFVRPGAQIAKLLKEPTPRTDVLPVPPAASTPQASALEEERRRLEDERRRLEAERALLEERKKLEAERQALEEQRKRLETPQAPPVVTVVPTQRSREELMASAIRTIKKAAVNIEGVTEEYIVGRWPICVSGVNPHCFGRGVGLPITVYFKSMNSAEFEEERFLLNTNYQAILCLDRSSLESHIQQLPTYYGQAHTCVHIPVKSREELENLRTGLQVLTGRQLAELKCVKITPITGSGGPC